jgi:hypothetical protein
MLQAHSFLWNYLWVAPNVLLLILGLVLWKRRLRHQFPGFLAFSIFSPLANLAVFVADISPDVSAENFWRVDWACLLIESLLKFIVIGEVFSRLLNPYPSLARLGRNLVSGFGAALVLSATLAAALSHGGSPVRVVSAFHLLSQTVFIIELGLIVFAFLFASYFKLAWDRLSFGVLLGFGISSCVYLACWAISTNADPKSPWRIILDLIDMATYHACVLLWFYFLLVPKKAPAVEAAPRLPETNLELWNRELERLLQQ